MKNFTPLFTLVIACLIVMSCAVSNTQTSYTTSKQLTTLGDSTKTITKGNISIKLTKIPEEEYSKEVYNQPITVRHYQLIGSVPVTTTTTIPIALYADLIAFKVTIENNTDHIIRIKDSRIAIIPEGKNPEFAVFKKDLESNPDSYKNIFKSWEATKQVLSKMFILEKYGTEYTISNAENKKVLEENINFAFSKMIDEINFVYDMNNEILPGYSMNGVLLFDEDPNNIQEAEIAFFDIVTKTDKAGNIVEKTKFEFPLNQINRYWEMTPNRKTWEMVSEQHYKNKVNNPDTYEYNKETKEWQLLETGK